MLLCGFWTAATAERPGCDSMTVTPKGILSFITYVCHDTTLEIIVEPLEIL